MEVETEEGTSMKASIGTNEKRWKQRVIRERIMSKWNVPESCTKPTSLSVSADHVHELSTIAVTYHCSGIWCPNLAYSREANDLFLPFKKRDSAERHLVLPWSQDLCNVREIKEPCAFAPNFLDTQSGPPEELWEQIDKSNMAAWKTNLNVNLWRQTWPK